MVTETKQTPSFKMANGITVPIVHGIVTGMIWEEIRTNKYEADITEALPDLVEHGERVLELGGGMGIVSQRLANLRKCDLIKVVEPNPEMITYMEKLYACNHNDDLTVIPHIIQGLAQVNPPKKQVPFYIREEFWNSNLSPTIPDFEDPKNSVIHHKKEIEVRVLDFNDLITAFNFSMLIIDIEGAEYQILGSRKLKIPTVNKIFVEIHPLLLKPRQIRTIFSKLFQRGFYYSPQYSNGKNIYFYR